MKIILFFTLLLLTKSQTTNGECGDSCEWTFNSQTKTLNIIGSGYISDYSTSSPTYKEHINNIKHLIIGNDITSIGNNAFQHFTELLTVTFGNRITRIGNYAFDGCTKMGDISITGSVTELGTHVFSNCKSTTLAFLGFGLKIIPESTFENCTNLKVFILQQNVERIEKKVFYNCEKLNMITFTKPLQYLGESSFENTGLISLDIIVTTLDKNSFKNCTSLRQVFVRNVQTIGEYSFSDNINLEHVTIHAEVQTIGKHAFDNCPKLSDLIYYGMNQPNCEENALMQSTEVTVDGDYSKDRFCSATPTIMGTIESGLKTFSTGIIVFVILTILVLLIIIIALISFILYTKIKERKAFDYNFVKMDNEAVDVHDDPVDMTL